MLPPASSWTSDQCGNPHQRFLSAGGGGALWPCFASCSVQLPFSGFFLLIRDFLALCLLVPALALGLAFLLLLDPRRPGRGPSRSSSLPVA